MAVKEESIERESEGRECVSLFSLDWGKDLERTSLAYGGFLLSVHNYLWRNYRVPDTRLARGIQASVLSPAQADLTSCHPGLRTSPGCRR